MDFPNFEYQKVGGSLLRTADGVKIYWSLSAQAPDPSPKWDFWFRNSRFSIYAVDASGTPP